MNEYVAPMKKEKHTRRTNHYCWRQARDVVGPLLIPDGSMNHKVEKYHDAVLNLVLINFFRHLMGTVSSPPELIPRMRPLFIGLNSSKDKVCRHNDFIQPFAVQQGQKLLHLLHAIRVGSF